ncbi:hypothetical protein GOBAR_AA08068 [Gossypium barbadense]|uniref:Uncharacterized protein n=1 Tax=Gossypium barbadense TaxID=3634 RepID=A0A2P5YAC8_GOSBA|nr:hypothetical protein GOBAR_AA08068 [Gossypium barbadense]
MVRATNSLGGQGGGCAGRGNQGRGSGFMDEGINRCEPCEAPTPVEVAYYQCKTRPEEMIHHIAVWGFQLLNFV